MRCQWEVEGVEEKFDSGLGEVAASVMEDEGFEEGEFINRPNRRRLHTPYIIT